MDQLLMLRFDDDCVHVTLDLLLPPTSHARFADAMQKLDAIDLRMADGLTRRGGVPTATAGVQPVALLHLDHVDPVVGNHR